MLRPSPLVLVIAAASALMAGALSAGASPVGVTSVRGVPTELQPYGPTSAAPSGGQVGPLLPGSSRWKYRGTLGFLGLDERVVEPGADPPPTVPGTAPLTGRSDTSTADRALVVKIDNVSWARPQVALNRADIVYEELVEGGLTRLAAVFHSKEPSSIGPVRSARSTDLGIVGSLNEPVFANSGSNSIFDRLIAQGPLVHRGAEPYPSAYWRSSSRPAPHNLFTSAAHLEAGLTASQPPAHFAYRARGEAADRSAPTASEVQLRYQRGRGVAVRYKWSPSAGGWARWQDASPHVDADGVRVAPENLVVQIVDYDDAGLTDKWGAVLYEAQLVGSGPALVFTDGRVFAATWTKPSLGAVTTFTDDAGDHLELTPGRTWVALVPPGGVTFNSRVCDGAVVTVAGTPAGETITGTGGDDVIAAGAGSDLIYGKGGDDVICAGGGHDRVFAGAGDDRVFGGAGDDDLRGGDGADVLRGESGSDQLHGERGADRMRGGTGADQLFARVSEDDLAPGVSDVVLRGRS